MRDLSNVNDSMLVLADAEQAGRAIIFDDTLKNLWRGGSYFDLLMHLVCHHREDFFEIVAALDGEINAETAKAQYTWVQLIDMIKAVKDNPSFRELAALFFAAVKMRGAASSGAATGNTVE